MNLKLQRMYRENCTVGIFDYGDFTGFTLELPYLENQTNISAIPPGFYNCEKITSPSLGDCIDVKDVIGRTYIRIHAGNYTSQILGCVLVGDSITDINGDDIPDVTNSKKTLTTLLSVLPDKFVTEIN